MVTYEPPTFYGYQVSDTWIVDDWLFAMDQYFDHMGVSNEFEKVDQARTYLACTALEDWHYCVDLHLNCHSSPITWTKMKANFRTIYAPERSQQDCPFQFSYGISQGRQANKVSVHSLSSPKLSSAWWSRLEQHFENLRKIIQDQTKASHKETNNFETSNKRDNSVDPSILSATLEVQDLQVPTYVTSTFVHEEELIVKPTQQVFVEAQLDEVDKIGTMVSSTVEEKAVLFSTLHPHVDFVIPDIFTDVMVPKVLLLSMLAKVIPAFKQASSVQILILPHFQTRGRVFSNQKSMMWHNLLNIVFWISILNFEFLIFEFSFYCG
jgi:hypothetical protein